MLKVPNESLATRPITSHQYVFWQTNISDFVSIREIHPFAFRPFPHFPLLACRDGVWSAGGVSVWDGE